MNAALLNWAGRALGLALIVAVLWLVGWQDSVTTPDGETLRGTIVEIVPEQEVRIRDEQGVEHTVPNPAADAVHQGLRSTFRGLAEAPQFALLGIALQLLAVIIIALRWGVLLDGAGLGLPLRSVFRLSWIGHFLGTVIPGGLASGDVLKALYVAKERKATRTRALVTAFTDRVLALLVLGAIAATALLLVRSGPRFETARTVLFLLMGAGALVALLFYSAGIRAVLRIHHLTNKLPFPGVVNEIKKALLLYRHRPRHVLATLALAAVGHLLILAAFWCYGRALGVWVPPIAIFVAIPVAQVLSSIPGLPGGWGFGDFAFYFFLPAAGVAAGPAVALSITFRLVQTLLGLPGGLMLSRRKTPADSEALAAVEG